MAVTEDGVGAFITGELIGFYPPKASRSRRPVNKLVMAGVEDFRGSEKTHDPK
ncbi:protein of unknown function [Candidatus Filomicrobium marinum]|uniref:Uncharacterized protein n=1 Tax=Candidatus Filomicrobium marinum TaxID=1608628 RepID=A0A0D6JHV6_9HYPH|nr:protein of unknown function [Candidatus Filomicrobium marinum]